MSTITALFSPPSIAASKISLSRRVKCQIGLLTLLPIIVLL